MEVIIETVRTQFAQHIGLQDEVAQALIHVDERYCPPIVTYQEQKYIPSNDTFLKVFWDGRKFTQVEEEVSE